MIFVDTSVWIDFYNGVPTLQVAQLRSVIGGEEEVLVGDLVLMEVLQGLRSESSAASVEADLSSFSQTAVSDRRIAILAARHFRLLRARGVTVRKTVDCLIATRCIAEGWSLLYSDRDFDPFVAHLGLRSAMTAAA